MIRLALEQLMDVDGKDKTINSSVKLVGECGQKIRKLRTVFPAFFDGPF